MVNEVKVPHSSRLSAVPKVGISADWVLRPADITCLFLHSAISNLRAQPHEDIIC